MFTDGPANLPTVSSADGLICRQDEMFADGLANLLTGRNIRRWAGQSADSLIYRWDEMFADEPANLAVYLAVYDDCVSTARPSI